MSLMINLNYVRRINVNTVTLDQLFTHPYLNYSEASDILRFRKRKGRILHLNMLKKKKILKDSVYAKMKPYLIAE